MKRLVCFMLLLLGVMANANAQPERPYRNFTTQRVHSRLLARDPDFATNLAQLQEQVLANGPAGNGRRDTIALVFHILYAPGQPFPDEAQVNLQIEALNRDFGAHRAIDAVSVLQRVRDMESIAVEPGISFCLPRMSDDGLSPVHFIPTSIEKWTDDDAIKFSGTGGAAPLSTQKYLNIWVGNLDGYSSGYAQMPGGPPATDGIVIDSRFFGVPQGADGPYYNMGKTLTHLVGSYLGLYELWNDDNPCADDLVEDTPIHNAPNYGIGTNYHHISACDTNLTAEMLINFMDNTDDVALSMFTPGQKNRMKTLLSNEGLRAGLALANITCKEPGQRSTDFAGGYAGAKTMDGRYAFRLFPNPASTSINMELQTEMPGTATFTAYNILGETVWHSVQGLIKGAQLFREDCSHWGEGIFFVKAVFENGYTITQKLRLEKT